MKHIWCFVIDVLVEVIVKKVWRFMKPRAMAWLDCLAAEVLETTGFYNGLRRLAGLAAMGVVLPAGAIYLLCWRSCSRAT
jgi:hypothetical protein